MKRHIAIGLGVLATAGGVAAPANASRKPTNAERRNITALFASAYSRTYMAGQYYLTMRVSTVNSSWALVWLWAKPGAPRARMVQDAVFLLHKKNNRWQLRLHAHPDGFAGIVPVKVLRDLHVPTDALY